MDPELYGSHRFLIFGVSLGLEGDGLAFWIFHRWLVHLGFLWLWYCGVGGQARSGSGGGVGGGAVGVGFSDSGIVKRYLTVDEGGFKAGEAGLSPTN